jgi:hypothetical protein
MFAFDHTLFLGVVQISRLIKSFKLSDPIYNTKLFNDLMDLWLRCDHCMFHFDHHTISFTPTYTLAIRDYVS